MGAQVRHLSTMIRSRVVVMQVIPSRVGAHALLGGVVTLLSFHDGQPDVVYTEGTHSGVTQDDPEVVRKHAVSYDLARATALTLQESLALLDQIAEEHEHAAHRPG